LIHAVSFSASSGSSRQNPLAFSPDGTRVLTGYWQKTLKLWDTATGALIHALDRQADDVRSARFSPDGTRLLSGDHGGGGEALGCRYGNLDTHLRGAVQLGLLGGALAGWKTRAVRRLGPYTQAMGCQLWSAHPHS